jgi:hypothetical protein
MELITSDPLPENVCERICNIGGVASSYVEMIPILASSNRKKTVAVERLCLTALGFIALVYAIYLQILKA